MGCSPSKGNNLGPLGTMKKGRMLPFVPQETNPHHEDGEKDKSTGPTNEDKKEKKGALHTQASQKEAQMTPQKKRPSTEQATVVAVNVNKLENQVMDTSTVSLRKEKTIDKQDLVDKKPCKKTKKNAKGAKTPKKKDMDKNKVSTDQKVDFPEPLVKAHQAAYTFLNPSINKYDSLLGLLEQATQTQVSVQTMVAFMALRYEEIIEGLGEMAEEGEKVLKQHEDHLAWPSQMKNLSSFPPQKSGSVNADTPPDLLQQLLQYTTQRMRNVSRTIGGIGDSALEEAVEYFASVSELLEEKLKVKRAAEVRLMQLLTSIETASLQKPGSEDSALFSEDSGIGAENESLNGSENRNRRESCGSAGTNRSTVSPKEYTSMNISGALRQKYRTQISPSVSLTSLNSLDSTCTIMANDQRDSILGSVSLDDGEDDNNDEDEVDGDAGDVQVAFRMQSNSSPVSSEKPPRRLPTKRIENPQNVEMTLKMKNAISGKIQFVQKQNTSSKTKVVGSPKTIRREWTDEELQSPKRPQTAAAVRRPGVKKNPVTRGQRSRSAESLRSRGEDPTLLELERTQKDLNQKLERMSKSKVRENTRTTPFKPVQRNSPAHSPAINRKQPSQSKDHNTQPLKDKTKKVEPSNDLEEDKQKEKKTSKGPIKATPPPSPPSSPRPSSGLQRGRNSVKKLIDTFSQGIEEREGPKVLGALKGVRRCGVPVLPGLGNVEAVLSAGVTSCRPESTTSEKTDYLDLDSFPPPPLEVLMDNSFESAQSGLTAAGDGATKVGKSPVLKRAALSQRLRASVQSVTVLPSKGGLPQSSKVVSADRLDQQDTFASSKASQSDVQPHPGMATDSLCLQARKIINLRQSSDSNPERSSTKSKVQGESTVPEPNTPTSTVPPASVATSLPPATPPVSRGRILPSTPPTSNSLHRRLPSPHNSKNQSTPLPTVTPPTNRTLPTPPGLQRRLPSPPVLKQNILNSNSGLSHPFKAPSPPPSPKVQRWSRENSSEDSSSAQTFSNARSVFCPVSQSMFEAQPCSAPQPPQAWTSPRVSILSRLWGSRGRSPVSVQGPRPFVRRSQSDRRPSLNMTQQPQGISVAETCGSEPAISSKGLDNEPTRDEELWGSQSELRATARSASHPDLCVVGLALRRD
ncbi:photoreceptor cilium actin regulator [Kryptolebias marmoratus]|uniref:Photoreceptor cilium actin regulator n=1 Tax=Kryptolebias marmoratus TaxID=37003 RepID=A0A3Q3A9E6_KRYMA|nr:photoreceptor cilium actin regulator [Kryptolebias marmoratus]